MLPGDNVLAREVHANGIKRLLVFALIYAGCLATILNPTLVNASAATITLDPENGEVGDTIMVQGSGFSPLAQVSIVFGEDEIATRPSATYTDGEGEFTAEFEIPEYSSAGSIIVEATDDSNTASSGFTVINTPPIADEQPTVTIPENGLIVIGLTASDVNADTLSLEIVDDPSHGTLSAFDEDTGEVTYEPDPGYVGEDSFSFKANDGTSDSSVATISLSIVAAGEPPTVSDVNATVVEDNQVDIALAGADSDSQSVSFVIYSEPEHGTLGVIEESGPFSANIVYTPYPNYSGEDSFIVKASDGESMSVAAIVSITITGVNDAPVAEEKSVTVNENSKKKITLEASDPDGNPLTYTIISNTDHGNLTGTAPNIYYQPDQDYTGDDSFRFSVSDSVISSNIATVTIIVGTETDNGDEEYGNGSDEEYSTGDEGLDRYSNAKPVAYSESVEGTEDTPVNIKLLGSDMDGDILTYGIVNYPSHGEISNFNESSGELTYTPVTEYGGPDSFTFTVMDDFRESKEATVSISIEPVNDPPWPISMNVTAPDGTANITLSAFDPEEDPLQFALYSEPTNGNLTGTAPNLAYSANSNFNGYDTFLFTVSDGRPDSRIGVISIFVGDQPSSNDGYATDEGEGGGQPSGEEVDDSPGNSQNNGNGPDNEKNDNNPKSDESTTKIRADKSKVMVMLSWDHRKQEKGVESTLRLQFADYRTRVPLGSHIWYDLVMLDSNNNEILRKNDLIAFNSEDTQLVDFPADGTYHVEVNVKGMVDTSTNSILRNPDYTGTAIGIVVVPEFNSALIMVTVIAIMSFAIVIARYRGNFGSLAGQ